jgi:hypothetical protein
MTNLSDERVECLNEIRPGKICGAHLTSGMTWCPVCGEPTLTRRVASGNDDPRDQEVVGRRRRLRLVPRPR